MIDDEVRNSVTPCVMQREDFIESTSLVERLILPLCNSDYVTRRLKLPSMLERLLLVATRGKKLRVTVAPRRNRPPCRRSGPIATGGSHRPDDRGPSALLPASHRRARG